MEVPTKCDSLQSSWQRKVINALVEIIAKSDACYTTRHHQVIYALVVSVAKGDALQSTWQRKIIDALVEVIAKCDALYTIAQRNVIDGLIEVNVAKCDATNVSDALYIIVTQLKSQVGVAFSNRKYYTCVTATYAYQIRCGHFKAI